MRTSTEVLTFPHLASNAEGSTGWPAEAANGAHLLLLAQVHELEHEDVLVALQRLYLLREAPVLAHLHHGTVFDCFFAPCSNDRGHNDNSAQACVGVCCHESLRSSWRVGCAAAQPGGVQRVLALASQ